MAIYQPNGQKSKKHLYSIRRRKPHNSQYLTPSRKQNLQLCTQSIKAPHFINIYCSESYKRQRVYPNSTAPEM